MDSNRAPANSQHTSHVPNGHGACKPLSLPHGYRPVELWYVTRCVVLWKLKKPQCCYMRLTQNRNRTGNCEEQEMCVHAGMQSSNKGFTPGTLEYSAPEVLLGRFCNGKVSEFVVQTLLCLPHPCLTAALGCIQSRTCLHPRGIHCGFPPYEQACLTGPISP